MKKNLNALKERPLPEPDEEEIEEAENDVIEPYLDEEDEPDKTSEEMDEIQNDSFEEDNDPKEDK